MRIVAGEFKGRRIEAPAGNDTRPTTDRVREALMSSVTSQFSGHLDGLCVLDAFAGTGALGLETLSRGAARCIFFEQNRTSAAVLKGNIQTLGLPPERAIVRIADVYRAFQKGSVTDMPFDLVLLDPPYATETRQVCMLVAQLLDCCHLAHDAVIVYEHADKSFNFDTCILKDTFGLSVSKVYGKTAVDMMRYKG